MNEPRPHIVARFHLGEIGITYGCLMAIHATGDRLVPFMLRHVQGDYGNVEQMTVCDNERAIAFHQQVISRYALSDGTEIRIKTDLARGITMFMLATER